MALVGFFGPWIPHRAVALIVTGFELSEFAKFFPEVQARSVAVTRFLFLTPLTAGALIVALWTHAQPRRWGTRLGLTLACALVAMAALPQFESLTAPDYRAQVLLALGGSLLVLVTPLTRRWSARVRSSLTAILAAAGLMIPVQQFAILHPLVVALYNRSVGVGWGLAACVLGFGVVIAWPILMASQVARRTSEPAANRSHLQRKGIDMDESKDIVFYGTSWCPDCRSARRALDQEGVSYQIKDIDKDPEAAAYVKQVNRGFRSVPTIVFPDGSILVEPSRSQLREKLSAIA